MSEKLLWELIAYEEFANMNKTDSDESFKVKKGVQLPYRYYLSLLTITTKDDKRRIQKAGNNNSTSQCINSKCSNHWN